FLLPTVLFLSVLRVKFQADRDRTQNNTAPNIRPTSSASSTIAPVSPIDPISTSARPVGSLGVSTILTMIGAAGSPGPSPIRFLHRKGELGERRHGRAAWPFRQKRFRFVSPCRAGDVARRPAQAAAQ